MELPLVKLKHLISVLIAIQYDPYIHENEKMTKRERKKEERMEIGMGLFIWITIEKIQVIGNAKQEV